MNFENILANDKVKEFFPEELKGVTVDEFYRAINEVEENYFTKLRGDVSWFCKKFDYRFDDLPWGESKDSVERSIKFLTGEETFNIK